MKATQVVGIGLILSFALVATAATATPPAVGRSVSAKEAKEVVGAVCWYASTATQTSCSPGSHYICVFGSGGTLTTNVLVATTQIAGALYSAPCPCSSGYYSYASGVCTGGS